MLTAHDSTGVTFVDGGDRLPLSDTSAILTPMTLNHVFDVRPLRRHSGRRVSLVQKAFQDGLMNRADAIGQSR